MINLPPELRQFATLLDAQPGPIQSAFQYALCLLMVESGKIRLVETLPGENGATCIFETLTEESFTFGVTKPPVSPEAEAMLVEQLRAILDEDDGD
ncbi:MAG: hypothetical protein HS126_18900 [Anaerolineales bacterium]|nr:hypothetical protein [Anaerolineales bacterium]